MSTYQLIVIELSEINIAHVSINYLPSISSKTRDIINLDTNFNLSQTLYG